MVYGSPSRYLNSYILWCTKNVVWLGSSFWSPQELKKIKRRNRCPCNPSFLHCGILMVCSCLPFSNDLQWIWTLKLNHKQSWTSWRVWTTRIIQMESKKTSEIMIRHLGHFPRYFKIREKSSADFLSQCRSEPFKHDLTVLILFVGTKKKVSKYKNGNL